MSSHMTTMTSFTDGKEKARKNARNPRELFREIFKYLPTAYLLMTAARVCRSWYKGAHNSVNTIQFNKKHTTNLMFTILYRYSKQILSLSLQDFSHSLQDKQITEIFSLCPNLRVFNIKNCSGVNSVCFGPQTSIKELSIRDCPVSSIQPSQTLRTLGIRGTAMTKRVISDFISNCPNIEHTSLYLTDRLDCPTFKSTSLTSLSLYSNTFVMAETSQLFFSVSENELIQCPQLTSLSLSDSYINENELQSILEKIPTLKRLSVQQCPNIHSLVIPKQSYLEYLRVMCANMMNLEIANCQQLEHLEIRVARISDESMQRILEKCGSLSKLICVGCKNVRFSRTQIQGVKYLDLSRSRVDDKALSHTLSPLTATLKKLQLFGCDSIEDPIIECSELESLDMHNCFRNLRNPTIRCPNLLSLRLPSCPRLFSPVIECKSLYHLDISTTEICNDALERILETCPQLQHLKIDDCEKLKAPRIVSKSLKVLHMRKVNIQAAPPKSLANGLYDAPNTDQEEPPKSKTIKVQCPALKEIYLDWCKVTDSILNSILESCPMINVLSLVGCSSLERPTLRSPVLGNINLQHCKNITKPHIRCPKMKWLNISKTSIDKVTLSSIKNKHRHLKRIIEEP
eukprot:gb/GECH01012293.1/.p1 GENE.gb/GECH01012293.1/~~gb/GECH01012293.1/.p1  ORF type:complete len:628 (+),score=95.17 gb/GECH01012293.1/:1-1884(+)